MKRSTINLISSGVQACLPPNHRIIQAYYMFSLTTTPPPTILMCNKSEPDKFTLLHQLSLSASPIRPCHSSSTVHHRQHLNIYAQFIAPAHAITQVLACAPQHRKF
eukprot:c42147_g1_i1 orf=104-421(+)